MIDKRISKVATPIHQKANSYNDKRIVNGEWGYSFNLTKKNSHIYLN